MPENSTAQTGGIRIFDVRKGQEVIVPGKVEGNVQIVFHNGATSILSSDGHRTLAVGDDTITPLDVVIAMQAREDITAEVNLTRQGINAAKKGKERQLTRT